MCAKLEIDNLIFPAKWKISKDGKTLKRGKFNRAAGPERNQRMLHQDPNLVLVFHRNLDKIKGSKDMATRASAAGVEVVHYDLNAKR